MKKVILAALLFCLVMLLFAKSGDGWIVDSWSDGSGTYFKLYGDITLEASVCTIQGMDQSAMIQYVELFGVIVWCRQDGWMDTFGLPQ